MRDAFDNASYCRVAARKLAPLAEGFRFYAAEWLGEKPEDWHAMKVTGAQFRPAIRGKARSSFGIKVAGTIRYAIVTREEMDAEKAAQEQTP